VRIFSQISISRNLSFASILLLGFVFSHPPRSQQRYEDGRVSMACTYSIVAYSNREGVEQILSQALDEVDRIDRLMSNYKAESPLSQINREASERPVRVTPELFDFIAECIKYSRDSEGAFDITVGPLMKAWGFFRDEGRMPSPTELAKARAGVGYQHVKLDDKAKTVRFERAGVELDLGGIAKGYAVDRAVKILKEHGIENALVSAGGSTIYGLGAPPNSAGWEIKLEDPLDHKKIAETIILKNQALSVSGSSEKFFELDGVRYSHIMDPRTGLPVQGILSVAVLTDSGTAGDALDNVFYVSGVEKSRKLLEHYPVTEVMFFLPDTGKTWKLSRLYPR